MTSNKFKSIHLERGVAAFPVILAISAIILIIGLAIAFSGRIEGNISANQRSSNQAFHASQAGVNDAIMKVVRNVISVDTEYVLTVGNGNATMNVDIDAPEANKTTIISKGTVGKIERKIKVILNISSEGKVTLDSWEETTD